jgi:hypothetical protein
VVHFTSSAQERISPSIGETPEGVRIAIQSMLRALISAEVNHTILCRAHVTDPRASSSRAVSELASSFDAPELSGGRHGPHSQDQRSPLSSRFAR